MSDDKTPERLRLEAWVAEGKPCPGGCDGEPEFCHVDMLAFAASEVQRDREEAAKGAAPELAETEALFRKGTHYYGSHLIIAAELDRLRATVARMKTALSLRGEQLAHEIEVREQRIAQVEATVARLQEELAAANGSDPALAASLERLRIADALFTKWAAMNAGASDSVLLDFIHELRHGKDTAQRVERKTP